MTFLDRYTPEICSQLRQMAEGRQWRSWNVQTAAREDLLEDLELTYHLHVAAEVSGSRAGLPPMPPLPFRLIDSEGLLDPAAFVRMHARHSPRRWNQMDNAVRDTAACA